MTTHLSNQTNPMADALKELSVTDKVIGEKGSVMYASTGSAAMDFNNSVDQSSSKEDIDRLLRTAISGAKNGEEIKDLVISVVNKRNPRSGEGCKDTWVHCILHLYENGYPKLVIDLMEFVPESGCIKDWWKIISFINQRLSLSLDKVDDKYYKMYEPLVVAIFQNFWKYIDNDMKAFQDWKEKYKGMSKEELITKRGELLDKLSAAGKWAPREKGSEDTIIHWWIPVLDRETGNVSGYVKKQLRKLLVHHKYQPIKTVYADRGVPILKSRHQATARKTFSLLTNLCDVPEPKMCSGKWSKIDPARTPSVCTSKITKAWLNEKKGKKPLECWEEETGNRYPEDEDRVSARQILLASLSKVKGGVLAPYQLIRKCKDYLSTSEAAVNEAQWKAMIAEVRKNIKAYIKELRVKAAGAEEEVTEVVDEDIDDVLSMIDVSGSMECPAAKGITCMDLSVSLGIVTSELNTGAFKHMALSYSSEPTLFHFVHADGREYTLKEKYNAVMRNVGYTTDIGKAMDLVLKVAVDNEVPEEKMPSLLILSDGQFDLQVMGGNVWAPTAGGNYEGKWTTTFDAFERKFMVQGYSAPPMIYFWNLNSRCLGERTNGYQSQADRKGVSLVQGWNNASFKMVMSGQEVITPVGAEDSEDSETKDKKSAWDDFQGMIEQDCYVWVKELMSASEEGLLKDYVFAMGDIGEDRKPITLASLKDKAIVFIEGTIIESEGEAEAIAAEVITEVMAKVMTEVEDIGVEEVGEAEEDIEVIAEVTPPTKTWGQTIFGSWSGN
jgi:hypothetical protein